MNFFSLFKRKIIYNFKNKILIDHDKVHYKTLDDLFHFYGSDKANIFKKNNSNGHAYSKFYEKKLENYKNQKINILEIGSYAGASAASFVKFLPGSKVFCFDINISNFEFKSEKIFVFGVDINNKKKVFTNLKKIYDEHQFEKFDLIIDDGSHNLSDILIGLKFFFDHLKDKGLYVIEDFKHPNYYNYNRNIDHILIDEVLENFKKKKKFPSEIFDELSQQKIMNTIKTIEIFKGNLENSDIAFLEKN